MPAASALRRIATPKKALAGAALAAAACGTLIGAGPAHAVPAEGSSAPSGASTT
ncbi:hypothetical protein [Streptomyces swartbergensis]|uniref:hypothetical protein n=1 Tax=Streptomyces swartbergensis TaxID=487165 RepID=UPI001FC9D639|nr:hypothetical protein [Streptomyces swartbergensis]